MYQPVSLFIALRYIRGRPSDRFARFVSFFSTIGITLGVMALIAVTAVMNGFEKQQEQAILKFQPHALISPIGQPLSLLEITDLAAKHPSLDKFLNEKNNRSLITHIEPVVEAQVILQSANNISAGLMLGVNSEQHEPLFEFFYPISATVLEEGKYNVVLGYDLANALGVTVGDEIRILVPSVTQFTPLGRVPSQRKFIVAGLFKSNNQVDSQQLFVNQTDAARLMRYPIDYVTGLRLFLNKPLEINKLNAEVISQEFELTDWRARQGELFQAIRMEKNMMGLLLSLIIAVAAFNILTSLSLIVLEKQNEIAILQTLGIKRLSLLNIFVLQGALSGILGAILGGILGVLLCYFINDIPFIATVIRQDLPIIFNVSQFLTIVLSAILLALLSALYPAFKASKTMPADALRYE